MKQTYLNTEVLTDISKPLSARLLESGLTLKDPTKDSISDLIAYAKGIYQLSNLENQCQGPDSDPCFFITLKNGKTFSTASGYADECTIEDIYFNYQYFNSDDELEGSRRVRLQDIKTISLQAFETMISDSDLLNILKHV